MKEMEFLYKRLLEHMRLSYQAAQDKGLEPIENWFLTTPSAERLRESLIKAYTEKQFDDRIAIIAQVMQCLTITALVADPALLEKVWFEDYRKIIQEAVLRQAANVNKLPDKE